MIQNEEVKDLQLFFLKPKSLEKGDLFSTRRSIKDKKTWINERVFSGTTIIIKKIGLGVIARAMLIEAKLVSREVVLKNSLEKEREEMFLLSLVNLKDKKDARPCLVISFEIYETYSGGV